MKLIKLLSILIAFSACKKNDNNEVEIVKTESNKSIANLSISENNYSEQLLDNLLKCGDYTYMDGYFTVPDYGCIYQPTSINKLGNAEIYLVPKKRLLGNVDVERIEGVVKNLAISKLKENYDVYILIIDKKYLMHNDKMDVPYFPHYPYKQLIYKWKDGFWKNITTLNIKDEKDSQYKKWKSEFLISAELPQKEEIKKITGNYFIKTKVSSVETGNPIEINFYFYFETLEANLSIGTNNSLEAYCEGKYAITENNKDLKLKYVGDGICSSNEEESSFLIKKEKDQYYIKSKRFYDYEWQLLIKK